MPAPARRKDDVIQIRASAEAKAILNRAAALRGLRRCLRASEIAGARGVVAHAIDEAAVGFYERHGFLRSPLGERVMLMPIETVRSLVGTTAP